MKKIYFYALTALAFASCTSEDLGLEQAPSQIEGNGEIAFAMKLPTQTRAAATGATAATLLGNQFNVYGIKLDATTSTTYHQVFNDYGVYFVDGTKSESNSKGWEYVTSSEVTPTAVSGITRQKVKANQQIKFWDYSSAEYWFYAVSAANVTTTNSEKEDYKWYDSAGTPAVASNTSTTKISKCVVSHVGEANSVLYADGVKIDKAKYAKNPGESQTGANGEVVTFNFKRLQTKVRIGFYETVPGYAVNNVNFYPAADLAASAKVGFGTTSAAAMNLVTTAATDASNKLANGFMPAVGQTYTISYNATDGTASLSNTTDGLTIESSKGFGQLNYPVTQNLTGANANYMGTSSLAPSWATVGGATDASGSYLGAAGDHYWYVFPNEDKSAAFKLKVDYTLTALDGTKEVINVKGAEVVVPAEYCTWKGNYAYTYLFKISKNSNGTTGDPSTTTDPKGLYPITFDACVTDYTDMSQGTTTEISEYSITTYQEGSVTAAGIQYNENKDLVVTILDNTGTAATVGTGTNPASAWYVYTPASGIATKTPVSSLTNGKFTIAAANVKAGVYAISYKWHNGSKYVVTTKYVRVGAAGTDADETAIMDTAAGNLISEGTNQFKLPVGATLVAIYKTGTTTDANLNPSNGVYTITETVDVYYNIGQIQYKVTATKS